MSRSASSAVENNFVNGWITEATGLNFPENAVTETENIVYNSTGEVGRRLGVDLESSFSSITVTPTNDSLYTEYLWETVAGNGFLTFLIQQAGEFLRFYRVTGESLSDGYLFEINMSGYATTDLTSFRTQPFQFASGFGRLFVTHPNMEPVYLTYSLDNGTCSVTTINIFTRDLVGVPQAPRSRTSTLTAAERYNLYTQGWPDGFIQDFYNKSGGVFPSDYDVWWLFKSPDAFGTEVFLVDTAVNSGILNNVDRGNSPAPKGSIVLTEFYQDRGAYVFGIPVVSAGIHRPGTVAFFAGRVFYAGVQLQNFNHKIYFTQILESVEQVGRCYQANDPTSQFSSDLLASDGGVVSIPEAGTILKLWPVDNSLLVFASNGIWQITGSQGIGFSAVDYTVKKIAKQEILTSLSFVNVLGSPVWWSTDGIYTLSMDGAGSAQVKSISEKKIASYFEDLSSVVKSYAKGAFNLKDRIIQWVYREDAQANTTLNQTYTRILNYDISSEAFYPFTIDDTHASVKGVVCVQGYGSEATIESVLNNAAAVVTDDALVTVTVVRAESAPVTATFKYPTLYGASKNTFTFSEFRNVSYIDWASVPAANGGSDAEAFFISGYRIRGEAQKKFQSNYIYLYTGNETPSAFSIQGRWDYATSGNTGRWSGSQVIDMPGGSYTYNRKRIKIRGHGVALQYHIKSIPLRSMTLIGWSAWDTTNGSI